MKYCFITFRSITYGQQGERLMQNNKIQTQLLRTPGWMEKKGCGYCLRLRKEDTNRAVELLWRSNLAFSKVYVDREDGVEEWKV